jgi:glycosyltransferase involved in cell wall biosynthesis
MHVLMLSDVYFPRINGVSTSIETFRREFEAAGDRVTLMVPDYPGAQAEPGIIRIASHRLPLDPEDRRMELRTILAHEEQLRGMDIDLIHIQTPFIAHYAGTALAKKLGIPCVETYHTLFEEYFHHYIPFLPKGMLRGLTRRFSRRQCNALDGVIVPSSAMAERLQSYGVTTPLRVVPTGIPLEQFGRGDGAAFRQRLGLAPETPVALFVGRVAGEKNIDFLLHAHRLALLRLPELHLVVAGEGPALAGLRRLAEALGTSDKVRFVGYLHRRDELPACYAAADAFVFASRTETQGPLHHGHPGHPHAGAGCRLATRRSGGVRRSPGQPAAEPGTTPAAGPGSPGIRAGMVGPGLCRAPAPGPGRIAAEPHEYRDPDPLHIFASGLT